MRCWCLRTMNNTDENVNEINEIGELAKLIYANNIVVEQKFNGHHARRVAGAAFDAAKIFIEVKNEYNVKNTK